MCSREKHSCGVVARSAAVDAGTDAVAAHVEGRALRRRCPSALLLSVILCEMVANSVFAACVSVSVSACACACVCACARTPTPAIHPQGVTLNTHTAAHAHTNTQYHAITLTPHHITLYRIMHYYTVMRTAL